MGEDFLQPEFEVDELDMADAASELKDATVQEVPLMDESGEDMDLMDVLSSGDADLMDIGDLLNADENLEELDESRDQFEMAAEEVSSEGAVSAESGEEEEKGGLFAKIKGIISGIFGGKDKAEADDDGTVSIGDTSPTMEELSAEDENILSDFSDEETPVDKEALKAAKKAEKEAKKKEKEEAKKLKAEEKAKQKAEKAAAKAEKAKQKPPKEPDNSPTIPVKKLIPFVVLSISVVVLVLVAGNSIYHARTIAEAKSLYETGSYASAFSCMQRLDEMDEDETELYEKSRILAKMELKLRQYNLAMEHEEYEEALDALIQATYTYIRNKEAADALHITDAFTALGAQVESSMMDEFSVSEEQAVEMYTLPKRQEYTRAIRIALKNVNLPY